MAVFTDVPREIRQMIYKEVFRATLVYFHDWDESRKPYPSCWHRGRRSYVDLLLVCRWMNTEAKALFLSETKFQIASCFCADLKTWSSTGALQRSGSVEYVIDKSCSQVDHFMRKIRQVRSEGTGLQCINIIGYPFSAHGSFSGEYGLPSNLRSNEALPERLDTILQLAFHNFRKTMFSMAPLAESGPKTVCALYDTHSGPPGIAAYVHSQDCCTFVGYRGYWCDVTIDEARNVLICGLLKKHVEDVKEQLLGFDVFAACTRITVTNTFPCGGSVQVYEKGTDW